MLKRFSLALILAGLVYALPATTVAQDGSQNSSDGQSANAPHDGRGRMDPEQRTQMLAKHLNLTSDQQSKVLDILKNAQSQAESARSDSSTPEKDRHAKMMEIHKSADEQIRAVLDSTQQKKWDEMMASRGQGHHPNGPPDSSEQK